MLSRFPWLHPASPSASQTRTPPRLFFLPAQDACYLLKSSPVQVSAEAPSFILTLCSGACEVLLVWPNGACSPGLVPASRLRAQAFPVSGPPGQEMLPVITSTSQGQSDAGLLPELKRIPFQVTLPPPSCILKCKRKTKQWKMPQPSNSAISSDSSFCLPTPTPDCFVSPLDIFRAAGSTTESRRETSKTIQLGCNKWHFRPGRPCASPFAICMVPCWTLQPALGILWGWEGP